MKRLVACLVAVVDSITVLWFTSPAFAKHALLFAEALLWMLLPAVLTVGMVWSIFHVFAKHFLPEPYRPWVVAALVLGALPFGPKKSAFMFLAYALSCIVTAALVITLRNPDAFREEP